MNKEDVKKLTDSFSLEDKHALLLNTEKMDEKTLLNIYPRLIKHPIVPNGYIYDKKEYDLGKSIYHELGVFYLQEPSAMVVSYLLNPNENDFLLDMCAAPGGKTIGASLLMKNQGLIISNDLSKERCRALSDNIRRMGRSNVVIINNDFKNIYLNYKDTFTKIILDAPCSGSGMFRKDEKMINDWNFNKVIKNSFIQKELIQMAYYMLKPGGTIVYSTCSYSYEEDEEVIDYLLKSTDAILETIPLNKLFYLDKSKIGIHLFPFLFPGEGHYICLIKKPGQSTLKLEKPINQYKKLLTQELDSFNIYNFNNRLFALTHPIKTKGLYIYQMGMEVGELFHDKVAFDYHYAHYLTCFDNHVELTFEEANSYIQGQEIKKDNLPKGNLLLTYKNISLDFSKFNGDVIKNHYPKYYRKKVNIN